MKSPGSQRMESKVLNPLLTKLRTPSAYSTQLATCGNGVGITPTPPATATTAACAAGDGRTRRGVAARLFDEGAPLTLCLRMLAFVSHAGQSEKLGPMALKDGQSAPTSSAPRSRGRCPSAGPRCAEQREKTWRRLGLGVIKVTSTGEDRYPFSHQGCFARADQGRGPMLR